MAKSALENTEQSLHDEKVWVGIDNGVSGSIGIIKQSRATMLLMPTRSELSYTKVKRNITRINWQALRELLLENCPLGTVNVWGGGGLVKVFLERPMVNPMRFQATASALRAMEATLLVLEMFKLPLQYVDSREWQKVMLPSGIKGADQLKRASHDIGCRLFPHLSALIDKHGDADGVLMAEWARRERL
jgi:hypothetical protein